MQTIAITVGEDIIARNILETDFWPELKRLLPDARFVLVVQPEREAQFAERFGGVRVSVRSFNRAHPGRAERLVMSLARSGINTHSNLWSKMRSYYRGDSGFVATWVKRVEAATLGNSDAYKRLLCRLILRLPLDAQAERLFAELRPDALVPLSLTNYDFDVPLTRSAKARGIRILGMVRSWDNLSSHGLLRVVPDVFILQNRFLKEMAIEHQAVVEKETPIEIVGLPHYDVYKHPELLQDRETFVRENGLDPAKKIIYWVAMGEFLFVRDADTGPILNDLIGRGAITQPSQIIFSPHPKFISTAEKVKKTPHLVALADLPYISKRPQRSDAALVKLMNHIYHADVLVMGASTMAVDAAALDKPVVCIGFDGRGELPYWVSVKRFYDCYTHFEALAATRGIKIAGSEAELAAQVNDYLSHPEHDAAGRKKILELLVEPFDGNAGQRLAQVLVSHLSS